MKIFHDFIDKFKKLNENKENENIIKDDLNNLIYDYKNNKNIKWINIYDTQWHYIKI